jgi:uncharacterized protein YggE
MEREIVVRGTGEARTLPDLAGLHVEVTAEHKDQDEAYRTRTGLAAAVDAVLAQHADAISRSTVASLSVQPKFRWQHGKQVREGWRASRTNIVEVAGLDALGPLMTGLVEAGAAVAGPTWTLAPTNPAHEEARRAAAEDARQRAQAYAEALDVGLGPIAWIAEPGLRRGGEPPFEPVARPMMAAARFASAEPEPPAENLEAAEMTVQAAVEVGFEIL